jgi:YD repeat-containing protein
MLCIRSGINRLWRNTEYDINNNVIKTIGLEGEVNSYQYDGFGKLIKDMMMSEIF